MLLNTSCFSYFHSSPFTFNGRPFLTKSHQSLDRLDRICVTSVTHIQSGNQIHDRAPPPPLRKERLPDASYIAQSRRGMERRWNRGRERRARSMWGKWDRSPPGQGGRDSRDVKGHWVDRCGVTRLWQLSCCVRHLRFCRVSGGVRWLWQVSGGVRWLWQVRRPPGWSRRDRRPPGRSRWNRRPLGRNRRDRRPPGRSSLDPWQRLGPRGNWDTRGRESTYSLKDRGREFRWPW